MAGSGIVEAAVIVLGLFVLVVVCSLFKSRPLPQAFTAKELDEIRIRRESAKEEAIEDRVQRLKDRARVHRYNQLVLTARKDTDRLLESAQELWDAKGRSIYGDAWDSPSDENLPLRTLFNLPKQDIDSIRAEASRLLRAKWPTSEMVSLLTPPEDLRLIATGIGASRQAYGARGMSAEASVNGEQRARTASARRGPAFSRPPQGAPYVDTRFVYAPSPSIAPQLDFNSLNKNDATFPVAPYFENRSLIHAIPSAVSGNQIAEHLPPGGHIKRYNKRQSEQGFRRKNDAPAFPAALDLDAALSKHELLNIQDGDITVSFQEPGLTHPKPPEVPIPRMKNKKESVELERCKVVPVELV